MATYDYDALHRLTQVEHVAPRFTTISRYDYTLDAVGNRTQVTQHDGRATDFTYDSLHRLVREQSTGGLLANRVIDHQYDAAGNRMMEVVDGASVVYAYDDNDRLLSKGAATYTYDADGNTLVKDSPSGLTTYGYDGDNRLTSVDGPSGLFTYTYDADGNRVRSTENGVATHYLVDTNRRFAQVVEELDDVGGLQAHFTWGRGLVRQERAGTPSYYHADGHGSVRQLTSSTGSVTDGGCPARC